MGPNNSGHPRGQGTTDNKRSENGDIQGAIDTQGADQIWTIMSTLCPLFTGELQWSFQPTNWLTNLPLRKGSMPGRCPIKQVLL